jgi:hypothetical protein
MKRDKTDDEPDDDEPDDDEPDDDEPDDDELNDEILRWADRSPRLHGLVTTGLGVAGVLLNVLAISALGFYWPYVTALTSGMIGIGLWSLVTNHSFLQDPRDVPPWWKPGALVALIAGCILGFVLTHSNR